MTKRILKITAIVLAACIAPILAQATPTINSLRVQGYLRQSSGAAVANGSYNLAFGVFQNNVAIWGRVETVTVTDGLFSQSLSGAGENLAVDCPACPSFNANYTGATLNPDLLLSSAAGNLRVVVYSLTSISGANPSFDISVAPVATAFVADTCTNVDTDGVELVDIEAAAKTATRAGVGDAGKILLLDGSGYIDASVLGAGGFLPIANGGTGGTSDATARAALNAAESGANSDITSLTGLTTALSVDQGGTGLDTYTAGDTLYASGAAAISKLPIGTAGQALRVNAGATAPEWGALGVAGGGTGQTSYTAGDLVYATGATATAKLGIGTAGQALKVNAGGTAPEWGALDVAGGGTGLTTFTAAGAIPYSTSATALSTLAAGAGGTVLEMNSGGTAPQWGGAVQTCTPVIAGTTVAGAGTYTTNVCRYVQIGKLVMMNWYVVTSAHTGTGNINITGLPVTSLNVANFNQPCMIQVSGTTFAAGTGLSGFIAPNSTAITVRNRPATNVAEAAVLMDPTVTWYVQCNYIAN